MNNISTSGGLSFLNYYIFLIDLATGVPLKKTLEEQRDCSWAKNLTLRGFHPLKNQFDFTWMVLINTPWVTIKMLKYSASIFESQTRFQVFLLASLYILTVQKRKFFQLFGCPQNNFGLLISRQTISPDVNDCTISNSTQRSLVNNPKAHW